MPNRHCYRCSLSFRISPRPRKSKPALNRKPSSPPGLYGLMTPLTAGAGPPWCKIAIRELLAALFTGITNDMDVCSAHVLALHHDMFARSLYTLATLCRYWCARLAAFGLQWTWSGQGEEVSPSIVRARRPALSAASQRPAVLTFGRP